ncbi:protein-L-isoaspartate O-methyltransferase family protein [Hypericibacter sp.]|uniref:protein-L-isoaspartate O-methyltransferase family protein n=1 Tax=Hypericibacter sp. TaxID=2705401 RepID=UPI003D6D7AC4
MSAERIAQLRQLYADLLTRRLKGDVERLNEAFRTIPREKFLGPGPWRIFTGDRYIVTPSDDPALIYQDVVVALAEEQGINNGQPSLHARSLLSLDPRPGDTVIHVGVGTGYYTAILAHLVGPQGKVEAYEIDERLSRHAAALLADRPNVTIHNRSGAVGPLPPSDAIYVNAGATHPADIWLDCLRPGGRLLFPLTPDKGWGGMLLVGAAPKGFEARILTQAMFIGCQGQRDAEQERKTRAAFAHRNASKVRSLRRGTPPDASCWLAWDGCWLSTAALTST